MRILSILLVVLVSPAFAPASFAGAFEDAAAVIPNFVEVSPGLYRGGNPMREREDKSGLDALKGLGVAVVIDLQGADADGSAFGWLAGQLQAGEDPENIAEEKRYVESLGMKFVNLPFKSYDRVNKREAKLVQEAVRLLAEATPARPVFVHCEHGQDRTGLVVALHRIQNRGWTVRAAYEEWVSLGHDIYSWPVTGRLDEYFFKMAAEGGYEIGL